jgi:uncharacterized protein YcbX
MFEKRDHPSRVEVRIRVVAFRVSEEQNESAVFEPSRVDHISRCFVWRDLIQAATIGSKLKSCTTGFVSRPIELGGELAERRWSYRIPENAQNILKTTRFRCNRRARKEEKGEREKKEVKELKA